MDALGVRRTRARRPTPVLAATVAVVALASGCFGGAAPLEEEPPETEPTLAVTPPPEDADPVTAALALVPHTAEAVTVTDWDGIRARLGVPGMTGADPMTDRFAFWERVPAETVALTDGLLAAESSRFELDAGFTRDDVDWEAHWTGIDGPGWALAMRPDLDMELVRTAVRGGLLPRTAEVDGHLVVHGDAARGERVWASDPDLAAFAEHAAASREPVESAYLHQGCLPLRDALGPDADAEDAERLLARHDVDGLEPLESFGVFFGDDVATVRLGEDRGDVMARNDLASDWPRSAAIDWADAFGEGVNDPGTGRIGLRVRDPRAAAAVTLTGQLPFAVCDEVVPFEEPTGL